MRIGTRSLIFGAHQFALHPLFVAWAWTKIYGAPPGPRTWLAILIHDWGYWGKASMDGPDGERHVEFAASVMARLFGERWGDFCRYHSRFYAKRDGKPFSRLCAADKLAIALTPAWLYLPLARLSGELPEYMALAEQRAAAGEPKYASMKVTTSDAARWYADVQRYMVEWVKAHPYGTEDTWTPAMGARTANSPSGVWR